MHKEINWKGGQIEVIRSSCAGWDILHRTVDGGVFGVDWTKTKADALRAAAVHAKNREARLLVEG
jgi:hypothetical protein